MNVKMTEIIQKLSFQVENVNFPCCFPSWWVGGSGKSHNKGRRENYQPLIAPSASVKEQNNKEIPKTDKDLEFYIL